MKIAIIGLGDIAQKAYLPILTQREDIELVFCTRNSETLNRLSQQYRITETVQDYRQLSKANIDAVMIHSSTSSHPTIAAYFLQQGIATFVDKPLADNAFDCEKLYELAAQHRCILYMGFNRRFIPLYQPLIDADSLLSLRWEKNRFDLPGELRTFIFDDFIHPLDSVNIHAKNNVEDINIMTQYKAGKLGRLCLQWQQNGTILEASMNRLYGTTNEVIAFSYENCGYHFDSFVAGKKWQKNEESAIRLADWTPMLASKGFTAMLDDWLKVVNIGKLEERIIKRNLASHQLAEAICQKIGKC